MEEADRSDYRSALHTALASINVDLPTDGVDRLARHFELVVEANRLFNLTRITSPAEFAVKHHADSLTIVAWLRSACLTIRRVLDIGTGAGIPAVPLAVAMPKCRVYAIDGTGKKARFVEQAASTLQLENLTAEHARSDHRPADDPFDLACFKAIGPLDRCVRFASPHIGVGGFVVAYKTVDLDDVERSDGRQEAARLGFAEPIAIRFDIAGLDQPLRRALWVFRRTSLGPGRRGRRARRN